MTAINWNGSLIIINGPPWPVGPNKWLSSQEGRAEIFEISSGSPELVVNTNRNPIEAGFEFLNNDNLPPYD